jgi:hypothetical protein
MVPRRMNPGRSAVGVTLGESRSREKKPACLGVVGAVWVPSPSPSNQRRLLFRRCLEGRDGRDAPSPALDSPSASASLSLPASNRGSSCSEVGDSGPLGELPATPPMLRLWPCMGVANARSLPINELPCLSRSRPLPLASASSVSHDCCREPPSIGSVLNVVDRANWTLLRSLGASDASPSVGCREMGAKGG